MSKASSEIGIPVRSVEVLLIRLASFVIFAEIIRFWVMVRRLGGGAGGGGGGEEGLWIGGWIVLYWSFGRGEGGFD